ncbi:2-C-methyl-D-erythritol 2,4-cyclodiphosphate synthase [candidate division KSB1 bacterium]|nr:MAG: 2-C-methyl-D-erythritol 2,4-cyclodiphosphate synthase [candidate division KSB1 bacterium]
MRIGIGIDAHRFIAGKPLVLGGVEIPFELGLEAHSDGDVICHAILDALLGAAALGDKGTHFPPTDPQYKNIRSTLLLERTAKLLRERGFAIVNIDCSVVCEEPKLSSHIPEMKHTLGTALGVAEDRIAVKGTTTERMGFTGRKEGITAMAVTLLEQHNA